MVGGIGVVAYDGRGGGGAVTAVQRHHAGMVVDGVTVVAMVIVRAVIGRTGVRGREVKVRVEDASPGTRGSVMRRR